jgi:hypothetical protein
MLGGRLRLPQAALRSEESKILINAVATVPQYFRCRRSHWSNHIYVPGSARPRERAAFDHQSSCDMESGCMRLTISSSLADSAP